MPAPRAQLQTGTVSKLLKKGELKLKLVFRDNWTVNLEKSVFPAMDFLSFF